MKHLFASRHLLNRSAAYVMAAVILTGLSFLIGNFALDSLSQILIFGIAAIGLDIALGCTGLASFGHGAFFGLGTYSTIVIVKEFGVEPWSAIVLSTLLVGIIGLVAGSAFVRIRGLSFFVITLIFSQLLETLALKWRTVTGGSDGIGGLERPVLIGLDLFQSRHMFLFVLVCLLFVLLACETLIRSPFGRSMLGTRENEWRMAALGYDVFRVRLVSFTISALITGFAGGLYGLFNGFVSPDLLSWRISGSLLLMVILGGRGTLYGPVIGAAGYLWAKDYASSHFEHWSFVIGALFVTSVLYFPGGLGGSRRSEMRGTE